MTRIEALRSIQDKIPAVLENIGVGGTGYMDGRITPTSSLMKGKDQHGRPFVTVCLKSVETDDKGQQDKRVGVITVFQRYSDSEPPDIVTQARNTFRAPQLLASGAATAAEMAALQELVVTGKAVTENETWAGGKIVAHFELVTPEQALGSSSK
jgi:hypothetical protein